MAKKRSTSRRKPAKLWIQQFPWCRSIESYRYPRPLPGTHIDGNYRYPHHLRDAHLIVDEQRFIEFIQNAWQTQVHRSDLNVLEYNGLVMPIRKVLTDSLCMSAIVERAPYGENHHVPEQKWVHARRCHPKQNIPKPERGEPSNFVRMDDPTKPSDVPIETLRPTPFLRNGYNSQFVPIPWYSELPPDHPRRESAFPSPLEPPEPGEYISTTRLASKGLVYRPLEPGYWALLAAGLTLEEDSTETLPAWVRKWFPADTASALGLTTEKAQFGNGGVTRFYAIGFGERCLPNRRMTHGQFGRRLGQDYFVAKLIQILHERIGLGVAFEIEHALRAKGINSRRRIFEVVAAHWGSTGWHEVAPIPPIIPYFHRNVLLWLLYQRRGGISAERALKDLGALVGMKAESVKQACWAGRRALVVK